MYKYKVMDEKGRSMIEMLGVLAIVGVLSVAGIAGYSKAMAKYKINKVMDQVSTFAANTKTLFASVGSYAGLTGNERAYKLGLFPEDMVKSCSTNPYFADEDAVTNAANANDNHPARNNCVTNGMNGQTIVGSVDDGKAFAIRMTGLTKDACTALIASDWGGSAGFRGLQGTKGDGASTIATGVTAYSPADLAAGVYTVAKTECTSADANEIVWYFY